MAHVKPAPVPLVPPPTKKSNDRFVVYLALVTLVFLVAGFFAAWVYMKDSPQRLFRSAYLDTGPVVIVVDGWAIAARMSVQTSKDDGEWAAQNQRAILGVLQKTLGESDPTRMRAPEEVRALQSKLKDACNSTFGTDKFEDVIFTEFVVKQPL